MTRLLTVALLISVYCVGGAAQKKTQKLEILAIHLKAFAEVPLKSDYEAYRVTVWPTFSNPILIKVENGPEGPALIAKVLKGPGGYQKDLPEVDKEVIRRLSEKEFSRVREVFRRSDLKALPSRDLKWDPDEAGSVFICLDGSRWTAEQVVDGSYHYVERVCPEEKQLHEIGFELVSASRLKIKKRDLF